MSFTEKGKIMVSGFIENPDMLGINSDMKILVEKNHQDYLTYHRERVFENFI